MSFSPNKTQFYSANGAGRDSYIYGNNGGFCPSKEPCKIETLGKCCVSFIPYSKVKATNLFHVAWTNTRTVI